MRRHTGSFVLAALTVAVGLLAVTFHAAAQDAAPDLLNDAVDPYTQGKERVRFLRAAGVDSELTEAELDANATANDPFVRPFDQWAKIRPFDANKNGTIDWFEADAYRRAARKAIIAEYDKNADGKLTGQERDEANKALAVGRLPNLDDAQAADEEQVELLLGQQRHRAEGAAERQRPRVAHEHLGRVARPPRRTTAAAGAASAASASSSASTPTATANCPTPKSATPARP